MTVTLRGRAAQESGIAMRCLLVAELPTAPPQVGVPLISSPHEVTELWGLWAWISRR
jgi:hypothetical protein